jgi:hypothetical protein
MVLFVSGECRGLIQPRRTETACKPPHAIVSHSQQPYLVLLQQHRLGLG